MLTTRITPQDELPDFIIDEDEEAVGEGTEPPGDPESSRREGQHGGHMMYDSTR